MIFTRNMSFMRRESARQFRNLHNLGIPKNPRPRYPPHVPKRQTSSPDSIAAFAVPGIGIMALCCMGFTIPVHTKPNCVPVINDVSVANHAPVTNDVLVADDVSPDVGDRSMINDNRRGDNRRGDWRKAGKQIIGRAVGIVLVVTFSGLVLVIIGPEIAFPVGMYCVISTMSRC
jgi:hypothetical protein